MTTRHNMTQKSCIMVALLVLVGLFTGCNNEKSDNDRPFEFFGEAIGRQENFDKDTIVTPENIESLYRQYTVEPLFNGDYYLVRSKKSFTTSRYLSRLIQMKNGRQVAAKTFYDCDIDANAVVRLKNRIIVGLNSLRNNNYDSTFHMSTHKCRVVVLSDSLTPILGKRFYSQKGHAYIESLMQNTDNTFFCSVASGDVELAPKARYQFRARYNLYIERQLYITNYYEYEIRSEELNLSMPDWGNDLSDDILTAAKAKKEKNVRNVLADSINTNPNDSAQIARPVKNPSSTVPSTPRIPKDFVLVPAGTLENAKEWDSRKTKYLYYNLNIDSFYICKYELTQLEYEKVIGHLDKGNCTYEMEDKIDGQTKVIIGDDYPVRCSYKEFVNYCNERSKKEGYDGFYEISGNRITIKKDGNGYRLLNQFEWTFAAKGGNANENFRYVGSDTLALVGWYGRNSGNLPHAVGKLRPNSLGLYDMSGNVYEMLESTNRDGIHYLAGNNYCNWLTVDGGKFEADDFIYYLGSYGKNIKTGTRIALVTRGMENRNLDLKYRTK